MNPTHARLHEGLARFGLKSFRPLQLEICTEIVEGRDVFAILPTGGGKSLLYQLPATLRPGCALVVSPLIALMKNQVDALVARNVAAATLNSQQPHDVQESVLRRLREKSVELLYVSPELVATPKFRDIVSKMDVSLVAVDEAHCVAAMGHDFRPEYGELANLREVLGPGVPWIAVTATADPETRAEIVHSLKLERAKLVQASFARRNIAMAAKFRGKDRAAIREILSLSRRFASGAGIVYCTARRTTEEVAAELVRAGVPAIAYHAQMDRAHRSRAVELFVSEPRIVVVATIAFGMGIDRPDVRWIVHYNLPKSPEAYSQEIGRAGRDGKPSVALLLWGPRDASVIRHFLRQIADTTHRAREQARFDTMMELAEDRRSCRAQALLAWYHEISEACQSCDVCLGSFEAVVATAAPARRGPAPRFEILDRLRAARRSIATARGTTPEAVFETARLNDLAIWVLMYGGLEPRPAIPGRLAQGAGRQILRDAGLAA